MLKVKEACCLGVPESNRSLRSAAGFLVGSSTISVTEKPEQDFPAGKCFSPPPSSLCLHLPGYPQLCFCMFLTTQYLWAFPTLTAMGTHNLGGCFRQSVLTSPASPDCAGSLKHLTGCSQPPGFFTSSLPPSSNVTMLTKQVFMEAAEGVGSVMLSSWGDPKQHLEGSPSRQAVSD